MNWTKAAVAIGFTLALLGAHRMLLWVFLVGFSLVAVAGVGFTLVYLVGRRMEAKDAQKRVVDWPQVAELEHDTGIFDLYLNLGAEGHSEGVGDACRQCAQGRITQDMLRVGGPTEPPHGGFNTPCTCDECLPSTFAVPLDAPLDTFAQFGLTTEQATVCTHPVEARFLSPTGPACGNCGASISASMEPCAHASGARWDGGFVCVDCGSRVSPVMHRSRMGVQRWESRER